jgi:hypothetical protein
MPWTVSLIAMVGAHVLSGVIYTFAVGVEDRMMVPSSGGAPPHSFAHPVVQTLLLMVGQSLNLPLAWIVHVRSSRTDRHRSHLTSESLRRLVWWLLVLACIDVSQAIIGIYSISLVDPSVFSMIRISQLVFIAVLQCGVLPRLKSAACGDVVFPVVSFTKAQLFGLAGVMVGVAMVCDAASREASSASSSTLFGCALVLGSAMLLSVELTATEYLLRHFSVSPLVFIGGQGAASSVICAVVLLAVNLWMNVFPSTYSTGGLWDSVPDFVSQMHSGGASAVIPVISMMLATTVLDATGTYLTYSMTANVRPALQPLRSSLLWVLSLCLSMASFSWERLWGFFLSVLGALVFKKLVVV